MPLVSSTMSAMNFSRENFPRVHQAELMFPFAGHRRAGDIGRLHGGEELDAIARLSQLGTSSR